MRGAGKAWSPYYKVDPAYTAIMENMRDAEFLEAFTAARGSKHRLQLLRQITHRWNDRRCAVKYQRDTKFRAIIHGDLLIFLRIE